MCVCVAAVVGRQCSAVESGPGWVEAPWEKQGNQSRGGGLGLEPLVGISLRGRQPPPLELEPRWSKGGGDRERE